MSKSFFLTAALGLILTFQVDARCRYKCGAPVPSQYGVNNLAPGSRGLPLVTSKGYAPVDTAEICSNSDFEYSDSLHILPAFKETGSSSYENFFALCPSSDERSLKLFHTSLVNGSLDLRLSQQIPGEDAVVGYFAFDYNVAVMTESSIFFYEFVNATDSGVSLVWEYSVDGEDSFVGAPAMTGSYVVAFHGTEVVLVPYSFSGSNDEVTKIETSTENALGYLLLDSGLEGIYFCSDQAVHKVEVDTEEVKTVDLDGVCSSLVLPGDDLVVAVTDNGSTDLVSIDTSSFEDAAAFVTYDDIVYGLSHVGYNDMSLGPVGLLAMTTSSGFQVAVNEYQNYSRGDLYSILDSPNALKSYPTISSNAEPVLFTSEGVLSYTATQLVKFFSLEVGLGAKGFSNITSFEEMGFVASPLILSTKRVVAFTNDGKLVLYTQCVRYAAGDDIPENACPVAELTDENVSPYWMLILTATGAGFGLPALSYFFLKKSKASLEGNSKESEGSDTEDEYSDEDLTPPVPVNGMDRH